MIGTTVHLASCNARRTGSCPSASRSCRHVPFHAVVLRSDPGIRPGEVHPPAAAVGAVNRTAIPATEAHGRSSPARLLSSPTRTSIRERQQPAYGSDAAAAADHERPAEFVRGCTTTRAQRGIERGKSPWPPQPPPRPPPPSTLGRWRACSPPVGSIAPTRWWTTAGGRPRPYARVEDVNRGGVLGVRSRIGRCGAHRRNGFAARDDVQCGQLAYQVGFTARINPVPHAPNRRWPPARRVAAG